MVCCKCNRSGYCWNCVCVKANRTCVDCLPDKLGQYTNKSTTNENSISIVGVLPPPPCDPTYVCPFESSNLKPIDAISQPSNLDSSYPTLPVYPPMSSPTFTWGNLSGPEFATLLDTTYSEVVHWRRNYFSVPLGKAGRDFLSELSRLYLAYGSASTLKSVALTHGLSRKWTYFSRVVQKINHLLVPLDDLLRTNLIPAITGRSPPNELEYDLFALPAWLGGLGDTYSLQECL